MQARGPRPFARVAAALAVALVATRTRAVPVRSEPGTLHGFPSMSDAAGEVVADGELSQERLGTRIGVRAVWTFRDGRIARETASFRLEKRELVQERFSWVETVGDTEQRRFEVDFATGTASSAVREKDGEVDREEVRLELPRGRSFAGYGTALAIAELPLDEDGAVERITFVGFGPKPRAVTLAVRRDGAERIRAAGRSLAALRYTLHPELPFPLGAIAGVEDARLWFTRDRPRALLRAEQNLVTKDDPIVTIDVIPRGAAHPP